MADVHDSGNREKNEREPLLDKPQKVLKDPLLVQDIGLNTDFYSLCWTSLRTDIWEEKEIRGQKIYLTSENYFWLKSQFLLFVTIVIGTVALLLYEVFTNDLYHAASWPIIVLRITLISFAQTKMQPEFYQGICMFRYAVKNSQKFASVGFALFISFCQVFIATLTFACILLFVCMANHALELIMNFAALAVISDLDNWIGEMIVADSPHGEDEDHKNENYNLDSINDRMRLIDKMSLLDENLSIVDDQNVVDSGKSLSFIIGFMTNYFPWFLLPLLTFPVEKVLILYQPHAAPKI